MGKVTAVIACLHVYDIPESVSELMPHNEAHNIISRLVEETAHRVRNPLTVVKGFIQLYRDKPENIPGICCWMRFPELKRRCEI